MRYIFDYDDWIKYYLNAYGNSNKANKRTKQPWAIEVNKRFFEKEGYYLPTGKLITDVERDKLDEVVDSILKDSNWKDKYIELIRK